MPNKKPKLADFDLHLDVDGRIVVAPCPGSRPLATVKVFPEVTIYYFTGPHAHQQAEGFHKCALLWHEFHDNLDIARDTRADNPLPFVCLSFSDATGVIRIIKEIKT